MGDTSKSSESISCKSILLFLSGFFSGAFGVILLCVIGLVLTGCSALPVSTRSNVDVPALCEKYNKALSESQLDFLRNWSIVCIPVEPLLVSP